MPVAGGVVGVIGGSAGATVAVSWLALVVVTGVYASSCEVPPPSLDWILSRWEKARAPAPATSASPSGFFPAFAVFFDALPAAAVGRRPPIALSAFCGADGSGWLRRRPMLGIGRDTRPPVRDVRALWPAGRPKRLADERVGGVAPGREKGPAERG